MNESDTRAELIDPALREAGWGKVDGSRINREIITPGRLIGNGRRSKEGIADYVLTYHNHKLAVVEAKSDEKPLTEGLDQAKRYAANLQTRYAYATNGIGIYQVDRETGIEGEVDAYLGPEQMWDNIYGQSSRRESFWRGEFASVPFEDGGGKWSPRYYQHNAINAVLESIAKGDDRILLTLATGTGKTSIAFQIAWKLFYSRWNLNDWRSDIGDISEKRRRPRILFLADRNILANQAYLSFTAFPQDALLRIAPDELRKRNRREFDNQLSIQTPAEIRRSERRSVPKNAAVFFTIFQTFMTGNDGGKESYFNDYPEDFFDFIIIDECHRGGANDESSWREILERFSPAVQLGLTATPRRDVNADTYAYFGDPVYTYSLKEGINDGFLSPFKVRQIATTLDEYVYTSDDEIIDGDVEDGKTYTEDDFNKVIQIMEREKFRVEQFLKEIDPNQKTIVFCATQEHAAAVRDLINQLTPGAPANYCVRVTANDGEQGEAYLRQFQNNEKTIPTILTTSRKLSTGVDARNVRNIVLMRPVKSMIEFKQIVGRGTRVYDGKDYFTIYDFVKAYEHFNDAEWDGEPEEPAEPGPARPGSPEPSEPDGPGEPREPEEGSGGKREILRVRLADGKERQIQSMASTMFYDPDGRPLSAKEFIERLYGELPELFKDEDELRQIWGNPQTRQTLLEALEEKGFGEDQINEARKLISAPQSDLFDVLAYIAFERPPITREQRVEERRLTILSSYDEKLQAFLEFVLGQYVDQGVGELAVDKLPALVELRYSTMRDAAREVGSPMKIRDAFIDFQKGLYLKRDV
jgi:type I restriction enzyme R subunit